MTERMYRDAELRDAEFVEGADGYSGGYGESDSGDGSGYDIPGFGDDTPYEVDTYSEGVAVDSGPGSHRPEWD